MSCFTDIENKPDDWLVLDPLTIQKPIPKTGCDTNLIVLNYLSEFKTDALKLKVKDNLGLYVDNIISSKSTNPVANKTIYLELNKLRGHVGLNLIEWVSNSNMNNFVIAGVYDIKGERKNIDDNLPFGNAASGHTFNARLEVLDSSISDTINNNDKCITQKLTLSNRVAGDGDVYIRTGRGRTYDTISWERWGKLQQNIEVGEVSNVANLIDNGVYSGVFRDGNTVFTFVMVVINDYAIGVSPRRVSQFVYGLSKVNGSVFYRTRVGEGNDSIVWGEWKDINEDNIAAIINAEIKKVNDRISTLIDGNDPDTLDTLKGITTWIDEHGKDAAAMLLNIQQNTVKIDDEVSRAQEAEDQIWEEIGAINEQYYEADKKIKAQALGYDKQMTIATDNKVTIKNTTIDETKEFSFDIGAATTEKAGVMTAEDKKVLDNVNTIIYIGEFQNIQAVWDACKQVALKNPEISIIKYTVKAGITYNSGVVFQSFNYNDALVTQYYLYGGGQKHECNVRHIVTNGTTDEWQPIQMFTSYKFENGTLYGYKYGTNESEQNKVKIVKIPNASLGGSGLLSAEDKSKLQYLAKISESYDLNTYTNSGVYLIHTGSNDAKNYPVQTPANSVLRLTVIDSYDGNNHVITQVLNINNFVGGEGSIYIRSNQNHTWKPWAKLQTNVEVGLIDQQQMDALTDNGIYSGILSTTGETFVIICINNYAIAQQVGVQHISHLKYSLVVGTGEIKIEKRTRDAYGFWTDWENIGSGSTLPEATTETAGVVKLGTYINEGWVAISNIIPQHGSGIGFSIDSAIFTTSSGGSLNLKLGHNGGLKIEDGLKIDLGANLNVTNNAIPLCIGTPMNINELRNYTKKENVFNIPSIPVDPSQFKLGNRGLELINSSSATKVIWNASSNMNDFKTPGIYEIYGERTVKTDNLPITNDGSGHSIAAKLTVIASTLQPDQVEVCITQFLQLSNRVGGDGATYVRTYNENNNGMNGWTSWQKQMGMVETLINSNYATVGQEIFSKPAIKIGDGLNGMIDNGMYSGIYIDNLGPSITGPEYCELSATPTFIETFVIVVINDYAASGKLNLPRHITQLKYAVDAITGQSTVKKRVGTGDETISWGDWSEIGGGGSQEVDITDAVKAQGLPYLVAQGLAKIGVNYIMNLHYDDINYRANPSVLLDNNNKIVEHLISKASGSASTYLLSLKLIKNNYNKSIFELIVYELDGDGDGKYYRYIISNDFNSVKVSSDMTAL